MTARVTMGVQCDTANMGLAALAYSVIGIVHDLVPGEAEIVLFSINSDVELARMAKSLGISNKRFSRRCLLSQEARRHGQLRPPDAAV